VKHWFDQLRAVLSDYYPQDGKKDVVGYLRGSKDPNIWRIMRFQQHKHQMLLLGSEPPTQSEWAAAGVGGRTDTNIVFLGDLDNLIVLYGGFMVTRPWGQIHERTPEALQHYQGTIDSFRRNMPRGRGN